MKLPYCKTPCANCPFRKDTLKGWLGKERMTSILDANSFTCHKDNSLQCAGHMLINQSDNGFVELAERLSIPLSLRGQDKVFESAEACIEHHT